MVSAIRTSVMNDDHILTIEHEIQGHQVVDDGIHFSSDIAERQCL